MANKLFKIKRKKLFNSLDYITSIRTIDSLVNIDFTGLIGRDLSTKEKINYINAYPDKDKLSIIQIIFNDYIEHRIDE